MQQERIVVVHTHGMMENPPGPGEFVCTAEHPGREEWGHPVVHHPFSRPVIAAEELLFVEDDVWLCPVCGECNMEKGDA
jgi:hypothetical protein